MKLPLLLSLLPLLALVQSAKERPKEFSQIDKLRQKILRMDTNQENNEKARSSASRRDDASFYLSLVKTYKDLGDEIDRQFEISPEHYLEVLNTLWLWARTQSELRSIDGIYMTFRKMQTDLIDEHQPLNVKQWLNFARTILSDANASIPAALELIANFIVNERLFISAYQVYG